MLKFNTLKYLVFVAHVNFHGGTAIAAPEVWEINPLNSQLQKTFPPDRGAEVSPPDYLRWPLASGAASYVNGQLLEIFPQDRGAEVSPRKHLHDGSSWTLDPGAASRVNRQLLEHCSKILRQDLPITVIGAGVLRLSTAYDLLVKGFTKITLRDYRFDSLTSHKAGGLLPPVSMNNNEEIQRVEAQIGIHSHFKGGNLMQAYFANGKDSELEPYRQQKGWASLGHFHYL